MNKKVIDLINNEVIDEVNSRGKYDSPSRLLTQVRFGLEGRGISCRYLGRQSLIIQGFGNIHIKTSRVASNSMWSNRAYVLKSIVIEPLNEDYKDLTVQDIEAIVREEYALKEKKKLEDVKAFDEKLKAHGLTLEEFREMYKYYSGNMLTYADYKRGKYE